MDLIETIKWIEKLSLLAWFFSLSNHSIFDTQDNIQTYRWHTHTQHDITSIDFAVHFSENDKSYELFYRIIKQLQGNIKQISTSIINCSLSYARWTMCGRTVWRTQAKVIDHSSNDTRIGERLVIGKTSNIQYQHYMVPSIAPKVCFYY